MMLLTYKRAYLLSLATILVMMSVILTSCSEAIKVTTSNEISVTPNSQTGGQIINTPIPDKAVKLPTPEMAQDDTDIKPLDPNNNQIKRETRALWSWAGQRATSKTDIDDLVARVDTAHLNVILLIVYRNGTTFFEPSHTRFPDSRERLPNKSPFVADGYGDALSYLLAIRDQRRLDNNPSNDFEVHAWFTVAGGGNTDNDAWPPVDKTQPYMLNGLFPEFKLKFGTYYLKEDNRLVDAAISVVHQPKFRAYMTNLIAGLAEDYHVDGIHLDYIRAGGICFNNESLDYPGTEYDYPGCQENYKAWTHETYGREYTLWDDTDGFREIRDEAKKRVGTWQEQAVGTLVKNIHDEVKSVKPDIIISVASVANDVSRTSMRQLINGQAAWEWLDKGWIDIDFVTAYSANTGEVVYKIQAVRDATQKESSRSKIFPGLVTYNLDQSDELWSDLIVEQVNAAMRMQWTEQPLEPSTKGVALFRDEKLSQEAINALGNGPFKEPALPFWGE